MVKRALLLAARCASHCGTLMGLRVVVTESLPSSSMSLIDASGMITASTPLTFRVPEEASIELATASSMQSGPSVSAANVTSMFQTNSVAMFSERSIGFAPLRPNSFATLTSIAWPITSDSPMVP